MNAKEFLQPFCAIDDIRSYLCQPFKIDDLLAATNGYLLISVPDDGTVETNDQVKINLERVLEMENRNGDYIPLTIEPTAEKCRWCRGSGKMFSQIECDVCHGNGEFDYGSHTYGCKECEETGKVSSGSDEKTSCISCGGTGEDDRVPVKIPDGRLYNRRSINKIIALPGFEYLPDNSKNKTHSMLFRFHGGHGVLMPVRG